MDNLEGPSETEDVNTKIVSLEILRCKNCKQVPYDTVITCNNGEEIVCESCYGANKNDYPDAFPNKPLHEVLKILKYPCAYIENGCKSVMNYEEAVNHKSTCKYRSYSCPLHTLENCPWSGHSSHLIEHFEFNHGEHVFNQDLNEACVFTVNVANTNGHVYMIVSNEGYFLLHLHCNTESNKLYHKLYYMGKNENAANFIYFIEPYVKTNYFLKLEEKCAPLTTFDVAVLDEDSALDLSIVKQIVADSSNAVNIKVAVKNTQAEQLDEKLLSFFECPVCNHYMKPPIFQCLAGHSLCSRCRPKLGHCPSCRASFGSTRNYALESMTNGVRYPCIYRDLGCKKILLVSQIAQHESECMLRPYNCPFNDFNKCHWEGTHQTLTVHLKANHNEKVKYTDFYQTTIEFGFDQQHYDVFCMVALGEVFRVCHRRDIGNQNGYWAVQLVGPKGESKKYKYEVGLVDIKNNYRKMIRIDICQDLTNQDNIFNQCILIPITIISWFSSNSQITYYVKISKITP